jgi:hypothetical protein
MVAEYNLNVTKMDNSIVQLTSSGYGEKQESKCKNSNVLILHSEESIATVQNKPGNYRYDSQAVFFTLLVGNYLL